MNDEHDKFFVTDEGGPAGISGVFEGDEYVGALYIWDERAKAVVEELRIYDSTFPLDIGEADIEVVWSDDCCKCALIIKGGIRGVIDLPSKRKGRIRYAGANSPPIFDGDWIGGFEWLESPPQDGETYGQYKERARRLVLTHPHGSCQADINRGAFIEIRKEFWRKEANKYGGGGLADAGN